MEISDKNLRDIAAITSDGLYDVPTSERLRTALNDIDREVQRGHAQHYTELVGIQTRNSE